MCDPWKDLPKVIRIIGKRYKSVIVDSVDEDDSDGEAKPSEQELWLARDRGFESARDTVLHEALHSIEHALRIDVEEQVIHQMAAGILALMRDNPKLVKWLMAKEPKPVKVAKAAPTVEGK